jgi:hypothetical protein
MKYAKTAWLTVQGLVLLGIVGYGLLVIKERFVEGSHAISHTVFVLILGGSMGGAYGFSARRILREIQRVRGNGDSR